MSEVNPDSLNPIIAPIIADRLNQIRANIPPQVKLVAVSKYTTTEAIRAAYAVDVRDFAESRVQEIGRAHV